MEAFLSLDGLDCRVLGLQGWLIAGVQGWGFYGIFGL